MPAAIPRVGLVVVEDEEGADEGCDDEEEDGEDVEEGDGEAREHDQKGRLAGDHVQQADLARERHEHAERVHLVNGIVVPHARNAVRRDVARCERGDRPHDQPTEAEEAAADGDDAPWLIC